MSLFISPYENKTTLKYVCGHINGRQRIAALENLHFIAITIKRHMVNYALPPFPNLSIPDHLTSLKFSSYRPLRCVSLLQVSALGNLLPSFLLVP